MRQPVDALRSLKRYAALVLGPEWEIRLSSEKGVFHRPYARVVQIPSIRFDVVRLPVVEITASYQIVAFPAQQNSADETLVETMRVVDLLWGGFAGPGVDRGFTYRIPLYDYAGIPLEGPSAFADETKRDHRDYMRVVSPPEVVPYTDPDDELLNSVVTNLRVSWRRSARRPSTAPTVAHVNGTVVPTELADPEALGP